jgi:hypothetical protein
MKRLLVLALLLFAPVVEAQQFSSKAVLEFTRALTAASRFGVPRWTTTLLPACNTANLGAVTYDTTAAVLKVCNGTVYVAIVGSGGALTGSSVTDSGLTAGRVTFAGTGGLLSDDTDLTFATDTLTATKIVGSTSITDTGLTAARVTFAGTVGILSDDSDLTFATDTLTATKLNLGTSADLLFSRTAAGTLQMGADVNGAPVAQLLKAHNGITGSNIAGASLTLEGGIGTGTGVGGSVLLNRDIVKATGTTAQTYAPAFVVCPTKTLSNTTATAQAVATITTTSVSGGGLTFFYTVTASNGTLVDADTGSVNVSWNNAAGTVAATMGTINNSVQSNGSGTTAATPTVTVATNVVSIKVTPAFGTIVPTTVTGYYSFLLATVGDTVACQ